MITANNVNRARKYQLTINNPQEKSFTHDIIKNNLARFPGIEYWCMADEIGGEKKVYHTHIYFYSPNAIPFTKVQELFYGAHIEDARGSHQENRDYILKIGKWKDGKKSETSVPDTFEESGEPPLENQKKITQSAEILDMVENGASNAEIIRAFPSAMRSITDIDLTRQTLIGETARKEWRNLEVTYMYGKSGVGKTRSVMDKYGYENVCKVTSYKNPFDTYQGQKIMLFDEFRSSLPITDMLNYLDGYPVPLPCRYHDKWATYTTVFVISNIPFEEQYPNIQESEPETFEAFKRRFKYIYEVLPPTEEVPF